MSATDKRDIVDLIVLKVGGVDSTPVADNLLVHKAGLETITGLKTFDVAGDNSDIQIGDILEMMSGAANETSIFFNVKRVSGAYKYKTTNFAQMWQYHEATGVFDIYTAPSGTANTTITWTHRYSMDASGNIHISNGTLIVTEGINSTRVTPRTSNESSNIAPSIDIEAVDSHEITALAGNITTDITWSGTPTRQQRLTVSITDDGFARLLSWDATKFESSGNVTLPTTTVVGFRLDVEFIHNIVTGKFRCINVA